MGPVRRELVALVLALVPFVSAAAEDPPKADPQKEAERKAKVEAAKALEAKDRAEFQQRVNEAIDKGVAYLRTRQKTNGSFPGMPGTVPGVTYNPMDLGLNSLVLLTLAKSGVVPEDKALDKLRGYCLADYADMKGKKNVKTYSAAVLLMALDAVYNPQAKDETTSSADRYGTTVQRKKTPCKYPSGVQPLVNELVKFLLSAQHPKVGGWRYPGNDVGAPAGDVDMSNTQYALLGLNAACRCGANVPAEVWLKVMEYVLREQDKEGLPSELWIENDVWEPGLDDVPRFVSAGKRKGRGWTYLPGLKEACTGSMTTAGVACLAIVKERLADMGKLTPPVSRRIDTGILDGLAWLSDVFTVTDNPVMPPAPAMWHFYYLYGLERIGALTGVRYLAKQDWYRKGADYFLGAQAKDGHWEAAMQAGRPADNTESEIVETCFALLFLKRATSPPTVPITPPVLTGKGDEEPTDNRGSSGTGM